MFISECGPLWLPLLKWVNEIWSVHHEPLGSCETIIHPKWVVHPYNKNKDIYSLVVSFGEGFINFIVKTLVHTVWKQPSNNALVCLFSLFDHFQKRGQQSWKSTLYQPNTNHCHVTTGSFDPECLCCCHAVNAPYTLPTDTVKSQGDKRDLKLNVTQFFKIKVKITDCLVFKQVFTKAKLYGQSLISVTRLILL